MKRLLHCPLSSEWTLGAFYVFAWYRLIRDLLLLPLPPLSGSQELFVVRAKSAQVQLREFADASDADVNTGLCHRKDVPSGFKAPLPPARPQVVMEKVIAAHTHSLAMDAITMRSYFPFPIVLVDRILFFPFEISLSSQYHVYLVFLVFFSRVIESTSIGSAHVQTGACTRRGVMR